MTLDGVRVHHHDEPTRAIRTTLAENFPLLGILCHWGEVADVFFESHRIFLVPDAIATSMLLGRQRVLLEALRTISFEGFSVQIRRAW